MDYVSCAPATLYRDGGFYEGGGRLESLCRAYDTFRDRMTAIEEIYPPFSYARAPPGPARAEDATFLDALRSEDARTDEVFRIGAAASLIRLADCAVNSDVIYIEDGEQRPALWETHRPNDRAFVPEFSPEDLAALEPAGAQSALPCDDVIYFYLGSAGSKNYGHWLVDDLPRLKGALRLDAIAAWADGRRLVVVMTSWGEAIDRVRADGVRLVFGAAARAATPEILWLKPRTTYRFAELHYVTPVSFHPALKSPDGLRFAAGMVASRLPPPSAPGRRLFVTRRRGCTRGLVNAEAIEAVLARMGFDTIDVEAMDFSAQARVFGSADLVVGVMGAAMTNTMFCPSQARVVHLAPQGWTEPFFRDLAAVRGQVYATCFGSGDRSLPAPIRPFTIVPKLLRAVLDELTVCA